MHYTPAHKLSPQQSREEIIEILARAAIRLSCSTVNDTKSSNKSKESAESPLTSLDVSP